jgi:hypothetical protein
VIHERRHGDCKDKALLLCALLASSACLPAGADLRRPDAQQDDLELAMVQHFNHCIAWLPPPRTSPVGSSTAPPPGTRPTPCRRWTRARGVLVVDLGAPNCARCRGRRQGHRTVLRYKLPPGFEPSSLPEPVNLQTAFGSFAMRWVAEPGTLRVERTLSYTANRIEPQEYPQFRDFAAAVQRAEGQVAIIKAKGGAR